jgi:hypothetical protein
MGQEVHGNNFNTPKRWFAQKDGGLPAKVDEKKLKIGCRQWHEAFGSNFPEQ